MLELARQNKRALAIGALLIFIFQLAFQAYFCKDNFCADDSFRYKHIIENLVQNHQVSAVDWDVFLPSGFAVFVPMLAMEPFAGPVWAIRLTSALISAAFFVLFSALLLRFLPVRWAVPAAFFSIFSFWWMQTALGLYKNELGLLFLLAFAMLLMDWMKKPSIQTAFWPLLALGALALAHASLFYFCIISLAIFALIMLIERRQVLPAALVAVLLAAIVWVGALKIPTDLPKPDGSQLTIVLSFILSLPLAFAGFYFIHKRSRADSALLSSFSLAGLLLSSGIMPADWSWRFCIDALWAVSVGVFVALSQHAQSLGRPSTSWHWSTHAMTALAAISLFGFIVIGSPLSLVWTHDQCSAQEEAQLAAHIKTTNPSAIFITDSSSRFGNLQKLFVYQGFLGTVMEGFCPAPDETKAGSFEIYNLNAYQNNDSIRSRMVSQLRKNNSGSRFYWVRCPSTKPA